MTNDNFVPDAVLETTSGLTFYKNREIEGSKTTYRVIEIQGEGVKADHPFIKELFSQYATSILKDSHSFEDFANELQQGDFRVTLISDIKGDKVFDDRWDRVVRFIEKHSSVVPSKELLVVNV